MTLRDEWEFEYTAAKLADAAQAQREFRDSRIKAWEEKKTEVMQKIRDSGISITEAIADQLYMSSGKFSQGITGRGAHITIDATLQDDLSECVEKIRNHTAMRNGYDAWSQVLNDNPDARLKLTHDDWMYFFGK